MSDNITATKLIGTFEILTAEMEEYVLASLLDLTYSNLMIFMEKRDKSVEVTEAERIKISELLDSIIGYSKAELDQYSEKARIESLYHVVRRVETFNATLKQGKILTLQELLEDNA